MTSMQPADTISRRNHRRRGHLPNISFSYTVPKRQAVCVAALRHHYIVLSHVSMLHPQHLVSWHASTEVTLCTDCDQCGMTYERCAAPGGQLPWAEGLSVRNRAFAIRSAILWYCALFAKCFLVSTCISAVAHRPGKTGCLLCP